MSTFPGLILGTLLLIFYHSVGLISNAKSANQIAVHGNINCLELVNSVYISCIVPLHDRSVTIHELLYNVTSKKYDQEPSYSTHFRDVCDMFNIFGCSVVFAGLR